MISSIDGFDIQKAGPIDFRYVVADQTARLALTWVYKGLLTYQLDNTTFYKYKGVPPSNLVGDWDTILNTGAAGTPGSVWYNGSGVPGGGLGIVGDYYLDTANGNTYQKTGVATWTLIANLKGPTGASGTASGDYASLYVLAGATPQSLTTAYAKITQFVTNGPAVGSVPDAATSKITVTNSGDYTLWLTADTLGVAAKQYQFIVYVNGVAVPSATMTIDTTTDIYQHVSLQVPVNIAVNGYVVEIYGKCITGTNNFTFVTGNWGVIGINSKGATGNTGAALIHTEHDITLDDAKVTAVQGGSWTTIAPWSASVVADSRSSLSVPAAITGNKVGHSISYNGTTWSDNGVWRGPSGPTGSTGATGATGPAGPAGSTSFILYPWSFSGGNTFQSQPLGWYYTYCSPTGSLTLGTGCPAGTMITVLRFNLTPFDLSIQPDSYYAGYPLVQRGVSALMYGGANLVSLPLNVREATFIYKGDGSSQWDCIGSVDILDAPVTSVNGLTGAVTIPITDLSDITPLSGAIQNLTNNLSTVGGTTGTSKSYAYSAYVSTAYVIPCIQFDYTVYRAGSDLDVQGFIEASYDTASWFNLKQQTIRVQNGFVYQGTISAVDRTYASPGTTVYYRCTITAGATVQFGNAADHTIYGVLKGGS